MTVRPDQIVGAQHVEDGGHRLAVEIAALGHALLDRLDLLLVDEDLEIAGIGEVYLGGEQRCRHDAFVVPRRHGRERHRQHGAADAIADRVHLVLAGRLLDHVERRERTLAHVILEGLLRQPRIRVDPGDAENRQSLVDAPFDEGFFRREVEHVEFVDPGRHDQQRALEHLLGRRRILDELHQVVLEDDLAGRGREIASDLEHRGIGLPDLEVRRRRRRCPRPAYACREPGSRRCW